MAAIAAANDEQLVWEREMSLVLRVQHVSVGIMAGEGEKARDFYIGALGLREKPRPLGLQEVPVIWFDAGDDEHEIHLLETENYVAPKGNHLCLEVDDLEGMRARMAQHGVETREAQPIDNRPRFNVSDPFGNNIELTEILGPFTPVAE